MPYAITGSMSRDVTLFSSHSVRMPLSLNGQALSFHPQEILQSKLEHVQGDMSLHEFFPYLHGVVEVDDSLPDTKCVVCVCGARRSKTER